MPISNPTSVSGCMLWLDAADPTTLFQDTAGTIPSTDNTLLEDGQINPVMGCFLAITGLLQRYLFLPL